MPGDVPEALDQPEVEQMFFWIPFFLGVFGLQNETDPENQNGVVSKPCNLKVFVSEGYSPRKQVSGTHHTHHP